MFCLKTGYLEHFESLVQRSSKQSLIKFQKKVHLLFNKKLSFLKFLSNFNWQVFAALVGIPKQLSQSSNINQCRNLYVKLAINVTNSNRFK
jgi:hypothetical protein